MAKITPLITYVILRRAIAEKYYTFLLMLQTSALLPNGVVRSRMFSEWQRWVLGSAQRRDLLPRDITLILRLAVSHHLNNEGSNTREQKQMHHAFLMCDKAQHKPGYE
jgi:hypothetical protein